MPLSYHQQSGFFPFSIPRKSTLDLATLGVTLMPIPLAIAMDWFWRGASVDVAIDVNETTNSTSGSLFSDASQAFAFAGNVAVPNTPTAATWPTMASRVAAIIGDTASASGFPISQDGSATILSVPGSVTQSSSNNYSGSTVTSGPTTTSESVTLPPLFLSISGNLFFADDSGMLWIATPQIPSFGSYFTDPVVEGSGGDDVTQTLTGISFKLISPSGTLTIPVYWYVYNNTDSTTYDYDATGSVTLSLNVLPPTS